MRIELNNGETAEFDEVAARARVHESFTELKVLLEQVLAIALVAQEEAKQDVKKSYYALSCPHFEFGTLANEAARHIRNITFWRDDYPLDGTNPWG